MRIISGRRTIYLTVIICMKCILSHGISTSCSIPSVRKGQKTNLTCFFSEDLNMSNNTVKIVRYTNSTERLQDTTVLLCQLSTKNPKCHIYPGYVLKGIETDKLSLDIFHIDEEHVGTYECHVFYSDSSGDKPCNFELKDHGHEGSSPELDRRINEPLGITTSCSVPSVGKGQKTNLTCYFSIDIGSTSNSVRIIRYTNTSNIVQDTTVLLCQLSSKPLKCTTNYGYTFEGNVTDKLTLVIPRADEEHVASYVCHVFYSQQGSDTPCAFEFNDYVFRTTSASAVRYMTNSPGDNGYKNRMDIIITLSVVLGLLALILMAFIGGCLAFYFTRIKPRQCKSNRSDHLLRKS